MPSRKPPRQHDTRAAPHRLWHGALLTIAALGGLAGIALVVLGSRLIALGGTPWFVVTGLLMLAAPVLAWKRSPSGAVALLALAALINVGWAVWEIGGKGWMPGWGIDFAGRVGLNTVLFALALLAWVMSHRDAHAAPVRRWAFAGLGVAAVGVAGLVLAYWERPETAGRMAASAAPAPAAAPSPAADTWAAYGNTLAGERFSPAAQVTTANVGQLREAWRFATGDVAPNQRVFFSAQNTPQKIGDSLYVCSSSNKVFALDPATGAEQWRFDPQVPARAMESLFSVACRSVGYFAAAGDAAAAPCGQRLFVTTADGRLIALDARDGRVCEGFGAGGTVDLTDGMAMGEIGFASNTAGPTVAGGLVIVGQQVSDNQRRDAPSGVVRAYDALTGALRWAWDAKRTDRTTEPLGPGEIWPKGTPNVWNTITADEELGLAFLGTGNAANDHFGGNRDPRDDEFSSAVVAVDLATGATRWTFRTVERDRWDYDIGAPPVVFDLPVDGTPRRVVVQATKTGSIFVLDARTGAPVRPVEQRRTPQGGVPGETLAPAQPQSVAYPNFAGAPGPDPERLDARHAFGLTPIDAAWCRIQFHQMRYEGMYTPATTDPGGMLLMPGTIGGPNWGGIAVDLAANIMITNHSRLPNAVRLVPRAQVADAPIGDGGARPDQALAPQAGSPWGVDRPIWNSPLDVPCISPPWGYIAATDLVSGRLLWSRPLGTGYDMGPLGIPARLRVPVGTPNIGGAVVTAGGLTFIAAAQDNFFRAYETASGRMLWSARLPAGGQAGPMTYMHGGRQYVAIGATGHARLKTQQGDSLVVFALDGAP